MDDFLDSAWKIWHLHFERKDSRTGIQSMVNKSGIDRRILRGLCDVLGIEHIVVHGRTHIVGWVPRPRTKSLPKSIPDIKHDRPSTPVKLDKSKRKRSNIEFC